MEKQLFKLNCFYGKVSHTLKLKISKHLMSMKEKNRIYWVNMNKKALQISTRNSSKKKVNIPGETFMGKKK